MRLVSSKKQKQKQIIRHTISNTICITQHWTTSQFHSSDEFFSLTFLISCTEFQVLLVNSDCFRKCLTGNKYLTRYNRVFKLATPLANQGRGDMYKVGWWCNTRCNRMVGGMTGGPGSSKRDGEKTLGMLRGGGGRCFHTDLYNWKVTGVHCLRAVL